MNMQTRANASSDSVIYLPQALLVCWADGTLNWRGVSPSWVTEWQPELQDIVQSFGTRPAGIRCPNAVFSYPISNRRVVCVRVGDLGDDENQPIGLGFQLVVMKQAEYDAIGGNPFRMFMDAPIIWLANSALPDFIAAVSMNMDDLQVLAKAYQRPESAFILGGCQAILDGNRLVIEKPEPATDLLADLWTLLPFSERSDHWPASFAFSNVLRFDVVVLPKLTPTESDSGYLTFEQTEQYPEGRYESTLQWAIESGDQLIAHRLLLRRSRRQTFKLGLYLLLGMMLLSALLGVLSQFRP